MQVRVPRLQPDGILQKTDRLRVTPEISETETLHGQCGGIVRINPERLLGLNKSFPRIPGLP